MNNDISFPNPLFSLKFLCSLIYKEKNVNFKILYTTNLNPLLNSIPVVKKTKIQTSSKPKKLQTSKQSHDESTL